MSDVVESLAHVQEAAIQQLNLSYHAEQDRLLLRIGLSDDSELMIWLTLRVTRQLWALLNGEAHLPVADSMPLQSNPVQAVAQFQQEMQTVEQLSRMDFATAYEAREEVRNGGMLLAVSVEFESGDVKRLHIRCHEGVTAHINLTQELILALCNMVQLSAKEASWDVVKPVVPAVTLMPTDTDKKQVLH